MKKIIIFSILSAMIFFTNCDCGTEPEAKSNIIDDNTNNNDDNNEDIPATSDITGYGSWSENYILPSSGNIYYLDAVIGSDTTGNGTQSLPWQTLARAQSAVVSGDTIYLAGGSYGGYAEGDIVRTDWVTYKAIDPANPPVFTSIGIDNSSLTNTYLRFDGIEVASTNATITTERNCTGFNYCRYLEFRKCKIHESSNNKYYMSLGFAFNYSENILIYNCEIYAMRTPFQYIYSKNLTLSHNHAYNFIATAIYCDFSQYHIIEDNNIYNAHYDLTCAEAIALGWNQPNQNPHGSGISLTRGNVIIRRNVIHDIARTGGIYFYSDENAAFSNITIENNLLYNITSNYLCVMDNAGENITIRNNTFVGYLRPAEPAVSYLSPVLSTFSLFPGYDGSGIHVYNNIFAGYCSLPDTADIKNNIFWSLYDTVTSANSATLTDNTIVVAVGDSTSEVSYFTTGFFNGITDTSMFVQNLEGADGPGASTFVFPDFTLETDGTGSPAINYGNATLQPNDSLGTATLSGQGFIQDAVARGSTYNAGCYK